MANFTPEGNGESGTGPPDYAHCADATDTEQAVNDRILQRISWMLGPEMPITMDYAVEVFQDIIIECRKLHRVTNECFSRNRDPRFEISWGVDELLRHVPIQLWPLPYYRQCPCTHCAEIPEIDEIDSHLAEKHPLLQEFGIHSEVHSHIASMLGIAFAPDNRRGWKCPLANCNVFDESLESIRMHVETAHCEILGRFYGKVGGFWTSILSFVHTNTRWPTIAEILQDENVYILTREQAEEMWKSNKLTRRLPRRRLRESPLDDLLNNLRMWISTEGRELRREKKLAELFVQARAQSEENSEQVERWLLERAEQQEQ
jgi:hypothetical protein